MVAQASRTVAMLQLKRNRKLIYKIFGLRVAISRDDMSAVFCYV